MTRGPDHTDSLISAKEAEIGQLRRNLEIAEAELRGMIAMRDASLPTVKLTTKSGETVTFKVKKHFVAQEPVGYRGGRQPGAISQTWRRILSDLYWRDSLFGPGRPFPIEAVVNAADQEGLRLRPSEAEARLQHYQQFNYVSGKDASGKYAITDAAADKFGFRQNPLKDEAPDAKAQEPQESVEIADQTGAVEPPEKGKGLYD